ncbi:MAG TPA: hypothetical protein PK141_26600 [Polyangiaceae bacterium]|nr:hypothetical protein [Polyangiaceae bacterium]
MRSQSRVARFAAPSLALLTALVAACSTTAPTAPPAPSVTSSAPTVPSAPPPVCAANTKLCGATCASKSSPELGCAGAECSPCAVAHASAKCSPEGACAPDTCENDYGDCNASAADGCEVALATSDAHCGGCGKPCSATTACRKGTCVDREVVAAEGWLATQGEGWCGDTYNQIVNLCGDVEFCFDPRFMREYPTGFAVDVGYAWESPTATGTILAGGGDCDGQSFGLSMRPGGFLEAQGFLSGAISVGVRPGKHLVSYQVTAGGAAAFVDGVRVGLGNAPTGPITLTDRCGPGLILGQRISYWWEPAKRPLWGKSAPFYVQIREGLSDAQSYSVARATTAGVGTVLLFDKSGARGSTWAASVGGAVGVAKNSLDGTPQVDAGASAPLPTWKPLAQCNLK